MKAQLFFLLLLFSGCTSGDQQTTTQTKTGSVLTNDTLAIEQKEDTIKTGKDEPNQPDTLQQSKTYSNERFKNVTVKKTGNHEFLIHGKAQIFEANFNWVVEDGHEELQQGHNMTDAGAPAWGNFSFAVNVPKKNANSTLHLVLFESSAKDGSRQYQLPLLLY